MSNETVNSLGLGQPLGNGDWAGWSRWTGPKPFEDLVGPFYAKRQDTGQMSCGCRAEPKNLNDSGTAHGGFLMTFAEHSLYLIAHDHLTTLGGVTISFSSEFLSPAPGGARLISCGDVLKAGRDLHFIRGLVTADGDPVLNFSGVVKMLRPRK
ncbi:PaaI family thioesterase [Bradyrhizobium jicamae]|uniref:PaaI family thioesterase n=1 Tax=Bradyrhizobium jicamae TaxID=280332 RepID=UPI001BA70CC9|nr:PaaI family thioesterase [Bradyrhizobium jicamae]MBR0754361.1 PaaI family thioesterase [Bradyrhizobium jicamae]